MDHLDRHIVPFMLGKEECQSGKRVGLFIFLFVFLFFVYLYLLSSYRGYNGRTNED